MPNIVQVGSFDLMNGSGVQDTPVPLQGSSEVIFLNGTTFQALKVPIARTPISATALAANGLLQIIPAVSGTNWLARKIVINLSVAGKLELVDDDGSIGDYVTATLAS